MKETLNDAIKNLVKRSSENGNPHEAYELSQAALNIASVAHILQDVDLSAPAPVEPETVEEDQPEAPVITDEVAAGPRDENWSSTQE